MKEFQSFTENIWVEKVSIELTETQLEVVSSETSSNEEKQIVCDFIKANSEKQLNNLEMLEVHAIYEKHKPTLKVTDAYEFISCDMLIGFTKNGIINCRINGEHKQVRF